MTDDQSHEATMPVDAFAAEAEAWLETATTRRASSGGRRHTWGEGAFSVAVFPVRTPTEERAHLDELTAWAGRKAERGYHAIAVDPAFGGLGLSRDHALAYGEVESRFVTPGRHELASVTANLVAPTVIAFGTEAQQQRHVDRFLRMEEWCCQLFSEPGAGSDLAGLACRAVADGDQWILNGQKVWTSGGAHAEWGLLIARSDPTTPKHRGMTAFLVPLDADGVTVVPIKQMNGSSSFCEVFFDDARLADGYRIGDVGDGWNVAVTTLAHERGNSSSGGAHTRPGGNAHDAIQTAEAMGVTDEPLVRDRLADAWSRERIRLLNVERAAAATQSGRAPGPEGSIGKLFWTQGLSPLSDTVGAVLGPRLAADTGEWGTYEWTEHVLGSPGYRLAGGTDEIQHNIIGERVLGLPREPGPDKNTPWNEIPR